jgi:hypothetical protein
MRKRAVALASVFALVASAVQGQSASSSASDRDQAWSLRGAVAVYVLPDEGKLRSAYDRGRSRGTAPRRAIQLRGPSLRVSLRRLERRIRKSSHASTHPDVRLRRRRYRGTHPGARSVLFLAASRAVFGRRVRHRSREKHGQLPLQLVGGEACQWGGFGQASRHNGHARTTRRARSNGDHS